MCERIFGLREDLVCEMLVDSRAGRMKEYNQRCFMPDASRTGLMFCSVAIAMLSPLFVVMIFLNLKKNISGLAFYC